MKTWIIPNNVECSRSRTIAGLIFVMLSSTYMILTFNEKVNFRDNLLKRSGNENSMIKRNLGSTQSKIPQTLIFTYKYNILKLKKPEVAYNNIKNTIKLYSKAWKEIDDTKKTEVIFLDNGECRRIITTVYPPVLPYFLAEMRGDWKSDICRIAALFMYGGYYFDADIEVVKPYLLPPEASFVTVQEPLERYFFQAFIAAEPGHPILRKALRFMELHYDGSLRQSVGTVLGPTTLKWAYGSVEETERADVIFLHEIWLIIPYWVKRYPSFPRQEGYGCCCNYAVHDRNEMEIYFYSRVLNYSHKCSSTPTE